MVGKIARNLRYLRTTRQPGYSQRELAHKLNISRSAYSRYEKGRYIPPLWFLNAAAMFYGVSIDQLVNKDLKRSENTKNENITQKDEPIDQCGEIEDNR